MKTIFSVKGKKCVAKRQRDGMGRLGGWHLHDAVTGATIKLVGPGTCFFRLRELRKQIARVK